MAQRVPDTPHETTETTEYETSNNSGDLLSQLSLTNVISLVGIGLTVYAIFFKKSGNTEGRVVGERHVAQRDESWQEPVETTLQRRHDESRGVHHEEPKPEVDVMPKPKTKPKPKFGM